MDAPLQDSINSGFLGSFLSNSLKTNQLEVNTDAKTLRPVARLKEPRDLFALPKERDHDCPQQAARWPIECQVLEERIYHIEYNPDAPEPYYQSSGKELQPRPVGEENGIVIYNYNPVSAVNYKDLYNVSDSEDENSSEASDDDRPKSTTTASNCRPKKSNYFSNLIKDHKPVSANDGSDDDDEDDDEEDEDDFEENNPKAVPPKQQKTNSSADLEGAKRRVLVEPNSQNVKPNCSPVIDCDKNNLSQFSRSSVGGSKYLLTVHPNPPELEDLIFESRFESGNLAKAVKITPGYYELYLRPDMYTNRHTQWFYFRVMNTRKRVNYRFSIVNLVKSDSLYNEGMRPLLYSTTEANTSLVGWRRCGENITYFRNDDTFPINDDDDDGGTYTLSFNIEFQHDNDTVYFAHSYPYTYSDLQDYLMAIQRHPVKSKYCKLRLLCRSLAGNNIYYLTVTAPQNDTTTTTNEDNSSSVNSSTNNSSSNNNNSTGNNNNANSAKKKRAVVVSARVHPGETPSSWMMKGLMDFITGDSFVAKKLRHKFIFKLIPMLNPDGVIVGNTRSSLTGKDLNRQYRTVIRETYPSIWYTKSMIKRLMEDCGVVMYCDMHAHSRKHNVFIYGCENKRQPEKKLSEQVFPLMLHKNVADKFSFENCKFKIQKNKEGTGRIVVWMLGVTNSYTMEASFGGTTLGNRNGTHFSTMDYEHLGRAFCETLMDYYDENPVKERLRMKILNRLCKEGSSADEPLNIPLSDYSSDEGDTSSDSSENEASKSGYEGPCCQPLKVPPSSPVLPQKIKSNKKYRKAKQKHKPQANFAVERKAKENQRPVLDIPITDPGQDFVYSSTEDEIEVDGVKIFRNNSSLRKSPQNVCGEVVNIKMPPELIITSAKKTDDETCQSSGEKTDKEGSPKKSVVTEFPPIGVNSTKRTKTWTNFNRSMSSLRISGTDFVNYESNDNLQLKLSLKKQIWAGAWTDNIGGGIDRSRPLSWGVPSNKTNSNYLEVREYDSEKLLIACSQKLAAWQETGERQMISGKGKEKNRPKERNAQVTQIKRQSKQIQMATTNLLASRCSISLGEMVKNRRKPKSFSLTKIVEATEFITHLGKNSKNVRARKMSSPPQLPNQQPSAFNFGSSSSFSPFLSSKPRSYPSTHKRNKFKTGGIVATVQPPKNHSKRAGAANNKKGRQNLQDSFAATSTEPKSNTAVTETTPKTTNNTNGSSTTTMKSLLVKKVKIKIKKKTKSLLK